MTIKTWQSRVASLPYVGSVTPTTTEIQLAMEAEIGELRARLAEYESREPVATLHDDGYWTWIGTPPYESSFAGWRMNVWLYGITS